MFRKEKNNNIVWYTKYHLQNTVSIFIFSMNFIKFTEIFNEINN